MESVFPYHYSQVDSDSKGKYQLNTFISELNAV